MLILRTNLSTLCLCNQFSLFYTIARSNAYRVANIANMAVNARTTAAKQRLYRLFFSIFFQSKWSISAWRIWLILQFKRTTERTNNVSSDLTVFLNVRNTFIVRLSTEVVPERGTTMDMLLSEFTHYGRVKVTYFCGARVVLKTSYSVQRTQPMMETCHTSGGTVDTAHESNQRLGLESRPFTLEKWAGFTAYGSGELIRKLLPSLFPWPYYVYIYRVWNVIKLAYVPVA